MSRETFEEKYAQSWADTPPHVRKLWLEAWQAATSAQEARGREGRDHDTIDSAAQNKWLEIQSIIEGTNHG